MNNSHTIEIGGLGGLVLSLMIVGLVVLGATVGLGVALVTVLVVAIVSAVAAVLDALSNVGFRLTHGGLTRHEYALRMRSERAENALAAVNERRDAELKAWMRQRGLPV